MTEYALSCIVCGQVLRNIHDEVENQPVDGVAFSSPGHYGSTVWDPMDGSFVEISVCDLCLVVAGDQGRVLSGRRSRPVTYEGLHIGQEEVDVPLVQWNQNVPGYGDRAELFEEDFEPGAEPLPKRFKIDPEALDAAQRLTAHGGE